MRCLFISGIMFQLLLFSCALLSQRTDAVKFSIPRKSNDQSISSVYIRLDSNAYRNSRSVGINPNGVRATYIIFFNDGTFKAPISFDQTLYRLGTFYNEAKGEKLYGPKEDWGRYSINGSSIVFEVALCEYVPDCRLKLKSGTFDVINDSTMKIDPIEKDNAYIFGKDIITFHKIDSLRLRFIDPSKAWHNEKELNKR